MTTRHHNRGRMTKQLIAGLVAAAVVVATGAYFFLRKPAGGDAPAIAGASPPAGLRRKK